MLFRYTLFYNAERDGGPVVKPLWVDFPEEKATFSIDDEHLLGILQTDFYSFDLSLINDSESKFCAIYS